MATKIKKSTKTEDFNIPEQEEEIKVVQNEPINEDGSTQEYDLEAGYIDADGVEHKTYTLREINGKDEEAISKSDVRSNSSKVISTLLSRCCLSIGTLEKKEHTPKDWEKIISNLTVGDQDIMVLKLREISIGEDFEVVHKCPHCGEEMRTYISAEEIEIVPFKGERVIDFELPRGYKDKKGIIHRDGTIRLPLGKDREVLAPLLNKNVGKARTTMLVRLCKFKDGYPVTDDVMSSLVYKDRSYLNELLNEFLFGVKTSVEVTCASCGEEFTGSLNTSNFI